MSEELNIELVRQQIDAGVGKVRQQLENYRALSQMFPVETGRPPAPHVWFGFIMLVRRPNRQAE